MDHDTLRGRVMYLIENCGLDAADLSRACGLGQSHLGQIARGTIERPQSETLVAVAKTLDVSLDWLMLGRGDLPEVAPLQERARVADANRRARDAEREAARTPPSVPPGAITLTEAPQQVPVIPTTRGAA